MHTKILKAYQREFAIAPRVKQGEWVRFERVDAKNPAWFWGADTQGVQGYFPLEWFTLGESAQRARALRDYDAGELSVAPGDDVEVLETCPGWQLVRRDQEVGWAPSETCALTPEHES